MAFQTPFFAPSELIITPRGAIYHLNLTPSELGDTVFLVGDPNRTEKVATHFDCIELSREHREFKSITGTISGNRVTVLSTGIGTDNIDIVLNELDALVNIDFETRSEKTEKKSLRLIRLGTSGSLSEDIPAGSVVVSAYGLGTDGLLNYYRCSFTDEEMELARTFSAVSGYPQDWAAPYAVSADHDLFHSVSKNAFTGITVTACGFYGPQGRILRARPQLDDLLSRYQKVTFQDMGVTNFEMETSAIYGMSRILGHRAVSVSVIVANRVRKEFSADPDADVEKMIRQVLQNVFGA
jgi:uridine phosphorylase